MASRGEIAGDTVKEWESATPKDAKLPERVKQTIRRRRRNNK